MAKTVPIIHIYDAERLEDHTSGKLFYYCLKLDFLTIIEVESSLFITLHILVVGIPYFLKLVTIRGVNLRQQFRVGNK